MAKPAFINLLANYSPGAPCDGPWANQCAIRMSIALNAEGAIQVNKSTYTEPKCAHGHARGAESLANWLWARHLGRPRIWKDGAKAKIEIASKTGIIFFKDCFKRPGESVAAGDHIDVWDRGLPGSYGDDQNAARQVWFWELT